MTTVHLYVIRRGVAECGGLYRHWRTEVADGRNSSEYFFEWKVRNLTRADLYVNPKASAGALGNSFASDALGAITAGDLVLCKLLIEKFPHRRRQDPFHQWARGAK
jgi:hypothetical protein